MADLLHGGRWVTINHRHVYIAGPLEHQRFKPQLIGFGGESWDINRPGQTGTLPFIPNKDLPRDTVQIDSFSYAPDNIFFKEKPKERPDNVPKDYVLVRVVELRIAEDGKLEFVERGYIYISAYLVNRLHELAELPKQI